jgi:hypothetical protein
MKFNEDSLQIGSLARRAGYGLLAMKFAVPYAFGHPEASPVKHSDTMTTLSPLLSIAAGKAET